ncbi:MAG: hypothetical protein CMJ67_05920 [Planctomycetaceae bacterium]|nr:hypothetical protein [Planctomycetaceae bacterium]
MTFRSIILASGLLVAAFGAIGCGGAEEEKAASTDWFQEEAIERGVDFTLMTKLDEAPWAPEIIVGGGGAIDFDDDGLLDLYLLQSSGEGGNRLFRNLGEAGFEDVTESAGVGDDGYGSGVATGDYDGDGDVDILVTNLGPDVLYRNEGNGTFTNVTEEVGLGDDGWASSAVFFDMDADGDLDLFITRYLDWNPEREKRCPNPRGLPEYCHPESFAAPTSDLLYRNDGRLGFVDVSEESGIGSIQGNGLGVMATDFDGDGWLDLFVANDKNPDRLWRNLGDGTFKESGLRMGCDRDLTGIAKAGMGVAVEDVDDDGDFDLIVCNVNGETDSFYLNVDGRFQDSTNRAGLGAPSRRYTRFGLGLVDFDNDSRLDYFAANGAVSSNLDAPPDADAYAEHNLAMRGRTDRVGFIESESPGGILGLPAMTSRGAVFGDFDNDGGVDVGVVNRDAGFHLLRNVVRDRGSWLLVDVRDDAGAPALGATVRVDLGDRVLTRLVRTDGSYMTARDPRVHVGVGDAKSGPALEVEWPDGRIKRIESVQVDRVIRVDPPAPRP